MMNNEKEKDAIETSKLDEILPKYDPLKLNSINLAQNYVSAFNTGMNIYQCVNQLQGYIEWVVKAVNDVVKSWNVQVGESIDQSKAIVRETTTEQFNTEWTNKQPELIEQVNTLTTNQFNEDWGVLENRINTTLETQNTNIQNIQNEQNELETNTNNNMNAQNTKINSIQTQQTNLASEQTTLSNRMDTFTSEQTTLSNRMDTFTSLSEGSTTGDAELQDIRVGANGVTYNNAGDAVRGQYSQLKEDLTQLIGNKLDYSKDFIGFAYGENNKALDTNGFTFDANGWRTSKFCLTTIGDLYFTNGNTVKICYYNNSGGFLKYEEQTIKDNSWLKINRNYQRFRVSYKYSVVTSIRYLDNDVPFAINSIKNLIGDVQSFSKNMIEKYQVYQKTALNSQGETFAVNNYTTTDYIEVKNLELFFDNDGATSRLLICVYDENKQFVNYREYYITDGINKYQPNITSGKYLRFSYEHNHISNIRFFNSEMSVSNIIGYTDDVGVSLFSEKIVTRNKALDTNGFTFDANGWVVTDYSGDCISLYTDVQSTIKIYDYTDSVYKEINVLGKHLYRLNKHTVRLSYKEQQINDIRLLSDDYSFTSERIKIIDGIYYKIISNVKDLINAFKTGGNYYIQSGEYDIIEGLGDDYFSNFKETDFGVIVKSGKYIFAPNAKIIANYTGDNIFVTNGFSPVNLSKGSYDVEIIGLNVYASNVKYAVHDEMGSINNPYTHRYSNCIISQNNCIRSLGGGLGYSGNIEIDGCIFNGITNRGDESECSYHNNISAGSMSMISIKNSIVETPNGSFRFGYYGDSTDITNIIVTNCKIGKEPVLVQEGDFTNVNMKLYAYNNMIG